MKRQSKHYHPTVIVQLLLFFFVFLYSCKKNKEEVNLPDAEAESAGIVLDWYKFAARLQLNANPQPVYLLIHRNFGYVGVGLYEAVRPGIPGARSLSAALYQMPTMPQPEEGQAYLWSASANAALASLLKQFMTGLSDANRASIDSMENAQNASLRSKAPEEIINRSQAFGRSVATTIHNWSTTDGFTLSNTGYTWPKFPGAWEPTPPAFAAPVGPYLKNSRPFLSYSLIATAPPLLFPYSEDPASDFYKAAKEVYDTGKNLTTEQKAIADWWADVGGAGVGLPAPYHTLSVINSVVESQQASLAKAAEAYAKTGIAMKDGPIIVFRAKYQYNLIRPVTYIRRFIDPAWQSYLINPPYSEYPSGLISVYGPVAQVLIRSFGDVPVKDDAYGWRGVPARQFPSISKMAEEAAVSRIYGGIHFRFTQYVTLEMGRKLGDVIANIHLKQ